MVNLPAQGSTSWYSWAQQVHTATTDGVDALDTRIDALEAEPSGVGYVNVKDYGAVGNGTTDDTTAIQSAITAVGNRMTTIGNDNAGVVYFPLGRYRHTAKLSVPKGVYLVGESAYASKLILDSASDISVQIEIGTAGQINTFGGIKSMLIDSNAKADTGVLLYGPQEGCTLSEVWTKGQQVICVDVDAATVLGTANKFVVDRCWLWTTADTGMYGIRVEGGILSIRSTTVVGTGRTPTTGGPTGSAGIAAVDAVVLLDDVNCEHWESLVTATRASMDMRGVSGFAATYGLRISADNDDRPVLLQNAKFNTTSDAVTDLAAGVTLPTASSYMNAAKPGLGFGQHFRRGWIEHDAVRIMRAGTSTYYSLWFDTNGLLRYKQGDRSSDTDGAVVGATAPVINVYQPASYTLQLSDAGRAIEMDSSSGITLTIPTNGTVAFPVGAVVEICQLGTGQVTIAGAGGVNLRTASSLTTRARYSTVSIRQRDTNDWIVAGDLT